MRWFSLFAGLWLLTIGVVAMTGTELAAYACWFVAAAIGAAGLSGLITALR